MPPVNAKCPLKMGTNGNDKGTFGINHGHLALIGDKWHWLQTNGIAWTGHLALIGNKWHWLETNGIDWGQMELTERTFGNDWLEASPACFGQMVWTRQCQMSLHIVKRVPLWSFSADSLDQSETSIWCSRPMRSLHFSNIQNITKIWRDNWQ